jgi:hypothetical protein
MIDPITDRAITVAAVTQEYQTPGKFKGGTIQFVEVAVDKAQYLDREMELRRALHD